jgi:hydroxyacylglutathione hydrolase
MILKTLVVGPYGTNCYIVGSESTKRGMIIDPGAESKNIVNAVSKLGLSIIWIVITHSHFDHTSALKAVKDATGAKVSIHEAEVKGAWQTIAQVLGGVLSGSGKLPGPDKLLKDGDVINIDELRFTVFSGDTLFNSGVGRADFPGCSHSQLMDSIYKKLMVLPDETIVYPGHGPETTIGNERRMNPFLRG